MSAAATLLAVVRIWLWIGAGVAALFLTVGIGRVDEDARGAWIFRPLLVPGILLIWPLVLWRWFVLETGQDNWMRRHTPPRVAHRAAAGFIATGIGLAIILGVAAKQDWPTDIAPVQLTDGSAS
ncbi:MAG: hypothetical protein AAGK37_03205 [Pseudomonadota bacterium]